MIVIENGIDETKVDAINIIRNKTKAINFPSFIVKSPEASGLLFFSGCFRSSSRSL